MIFHEIPQSPSLEDFFHSWETRQIFTSIDLAWGRFIMTYYSVSDPNLIFTVVFLSHLLSQNHITLNIDYWSEKEYPENSTSPLVTFDSKNKWIDLLKKSTLYEEGILESSQNEGDLTGLIVLEEDKVYFRKYYNYQQIIAQLLSERLCEDRLLIISGGPGTGKTTRVFSEVLECLRKNQDSRIILLAPTGKAANRLQEAVNTAKADIAEKNSEDIPLLNKIPDQAYTVHRFLENVKRPLSVDWMKKWDLVVVDEASMVSIPIFYELLGCIKNSVQLILLGDKDQLSSVEEGSFFYELVDQKSPSSLHGSIKFLTENYRYRKDSLIAQAAEVIRSIGNPPDDERGVDEAYDLFVRAEYNGSIEESDDLVYFSDFGWREVNSVISTFFAPHYRKAFSHMTAYIRSLTSGGSSEINPDITKRNRDEVIKSLLYLHRSQIILCAKRKGLWGVEDMNGKMQRWVQGLGGEIQTSLSGTNGLKDRGGILKAGDPVVINRNRYELGLYNGDIGVVLPVLFDGKISYRVFFEVKGEYNGYRPQLLGEYDFAYALTVHKSQGSEFKRVMVMLGVDNKFLTREICYTAITRARERVFFFMNKELVKKMLMTVGVRHSGLQGALRRWTSGEDKNL